MRLRAISHRKSGAKLVLIALLAVGLCMMPCGMVEHHGSMGAPSILCAIDLPHVFQLVIAMNLLLFALVMPIVVPQTPTFSLLKPPRFAFF